MKSILILLSILTITIQSKADILLWTIKDTATVDGSGSLYSYLVPLPYDDDNVYGAKIAVKDAQGNFVQYLDNRFDYDGTTEWLQYDIDIGHPDAGYVGAEWMQSNMDGLMEMAFQVEIGHSVWNYTTDEYDWQTILKSDTVEGEYLRNQLHTYEVGSIAPPGYSPWTPMNYYSVPEPSIIFLMLLGIVILTLKRRRI